MSFLDEIENTDPARRNTRNAAILTSEPRTSTKSFDDDKDREVVGFEQFVRRFSSQYGELYQIVKAIGTPRDSEANRAKIEASFKGCQAMVAQGKNLISSLSSSASSKPTTEKLKSDYLKITSDFLTLSKTISEKLKTPIPQKVSRTNRNYDDGSLDEQQNLLDQRRADLQHVEIERENNARIIAEREDQVRKIEQGVIEINEMFKDVAQLVTEQGILVDTINNNITEAEIKTEEGVKEITKAHTYQKKSRKKLLLILGIVGVILIILAIVFIVKFT